MNCIFIACRTVIPQPQGYAPPLGLVVYDVPLFTWLACHRVGFYESHLFRRLEGWPYLTDCAVWLFGGSKKFREGGRFKPKDDTFVIEYELAGGTYQTERLSIDDILRARPYDALTTPLPRPSRARNRARGDDGPPVRFRGALKAWLAARKAKLIAEEFAPSTDPLFAGLEEE